MVVARLTPDSTRWGLQAVPAYPRSRLFAPGELEQTPSRSSRRRHSESRRGISSRQNPFFRNAASHWPNVIVIPSDRRRPGASPMPNAVPEAQGFISRRHRSVQKDRTLLKRLEQLAAEGNLDGLFPARIELTQNPPPTKPSGPIFSN